MSNLALKEAEASKTPKAELAKLYAEASSKLDSARKRVGNLRKKTQEATVTILGVGAGIALPAIAGALIAKAGLPEYLPLASMPDRIPSVAASGAATLAAGLLVGDDIGDILVSGAVGQLGAASYIVAKDLLG